MAEAENIKLGVEQSQRDRRRQTENMQVMIMEMFVLLLLFWWSEIHSIIIISERALQASLVPS